MASNSALITAMTISSPPTSISTLATTQTLAPPPFNNTTCTPGTSLGPPVNGCAVTNSDSNLSLLRSCCNGAPLVQFADGCQIYCEIRDYALYNRTVECLAGLSHACNGGFVANSSGTAATTTSRSPGQTAGANVTVSGTGSTGGAVGLRTPFNGGNLSLPVIKTVAVLAVGAMVGFLS